jgi:crotonobetainyl-CoA:carnitine CoA-transferase CaiB-like acyl-CoA transferase
MKRPDLVDDIRFATNAARIAHRGEINGIVADWTNTMTRDVVLGVCSSMEVPAGPIYAIDEIFEDPQYAARGNILRVQDERIGEIAIPNVVPMLMDTPGRVTSLGPSLGSHTDEVLRDLLGFDAEKIAALRARGSI